MVVRIPMSKAGHTKLRAELTNLERIERMAVIRSIETALEHGDLKENAEYHAAKERQGHIEGRIMELKDKLGRAEVIDCSAVGTNRVVFGNVVTMSDLNTEEEVRYQLLGPDEAQVECGSISVLSPLGQGLIGKSVGDEVEIKTPGGIRLLEIVDISAPEQD